VQGLTRNPTRKGLAPFLAGSAQLPIPCYVLSMQEAMRMHPIVAIGVTCRSERDMRLGGYFVPKGTCITVALDAIHH
jgi:cytochrome P450